jgi:hypothetical protein
VDIAQVNLACARGLPGTESQDFSVIPDTLDSWAALVQKEINKQQYQFTRSPHNFNNSQAYFNILVMITVLQQDLGATYNMTLLSSGAMNDISGTRFFKNSKDVFLHGFFSANHGGSCSSMPVLVVAVGRRLGYPLKLVTTKGRLFVRWEDKKERFNIEASSRGLLCYPDTHYRHWPHKISNLEILREGYLKSLTPFEELAVFLEIRAMCLIENKRYSEALVALEKIHEIRPHSFMIPQYINNINRKMRIMIK